MLAVFGSVVGSLAASCAADPPPRLGGAGGTGASCTATEPLASPAGAHLLFSSASPIPGYETRLLVSTGGEALAYRFQTYWSFFSTDIVGFVRYRAGTWSPVPSFSEPVRDLGTLMGAMAPDGSATFVWPSGDAPDLNVVNLHVQTLGVDGIWSAIATVGDASVGWWQEPTLPVPVIASNDAMSILAWSRIDPGGGDTLIWSNERSAGAGWAQPSAVSADHLAGTPCLTVDVDGSASLAWVSLPAGGPRRLQTAVRGDDGWHAPQTVDQAMAADTTFDLGAPDPQIGTSPTGERTMVYARTTPAGSALLIATSRDGITWTTQVVAGLAPASAFSVTGNGNGGLFVIWASAPGPGVEAMTYSPAGGWSPVTALAAVQPVGSRIALSVDGRAAIAETVSVSVLANCQPRNTVLLHRFLPGVGWQDPETVDAAVTTGTLLGLGYAGDDLLVMWERSNGDAYAKAVP